jgi:hypothetical protein
MSKKKKAEKPAKSTREQPLEKILDTLHRARVEGALDRIAALKSQIAYICARAQHGDLSTSTAKTLSLDLEQELTRTICRLETWHFHMRRRA